MMETETEMMCGKCAAFGTNSKGPGAHSPGCVNDVPPAKTPKMLKAEALTALKAANTAPFTPGRSSGCGRAYVCLSSTHDRKAVNAVAAACKELGLMFLRKAYGVGDRAIYIGYDNADGRALAKSEAFAAVLNAKGFACYADAASD